jgi:hypothetical protein
VAVSIERAGERRDEYRAPREIILLEKPAPCASRVEDDRPVARTLVERSYVSLTTPIVVFEAGRISTGLYGVAATDLYRLVTRDLGMQLSTMERWLARRDGIGAAEFVANWELGPEFYFIAYC